MPVTPMEADDDMMDDRLALEEELVAVATEVGDLDVKRDARAKRRDELIGMLGGAPFNLSTRRIAALSRMTHQNAALILSRQRHPAGKEKIAV